MMSVCKNAGEEQVRLCETNTTLSDSVVVQYLKMKYEISVQLYSNHVWPIKEAVPSIIVYLL